MIPFDRSEQFVIVRVKPRCDHDALAISRRVDGLKRLLDRSALGRVRIAAVAVLLSDLTLTIVYQELRLVSLCCGPSVGDGVRLSIIGLADPIVSVSCRCPAITMRNYMDRPFVGHDVMPPLVRPCQWIVASTLKLS